MKTIKTLFAILFLSTMFVACDAENINEEEVGIEDIDIYGDEDASDDTVISSNG